MARTRWLTSEPPPTYVSRDEIGQTAESVRTLVGTVQQTIADYEAARAELGSLIGEVARSSEQVYAGSGQLAQATHKPPSASSMRARPDIAAAATV